MAIYLEQVNLKKFLIFLNLNKGKKMNFYNHFKKAFELNFRLLFHTKFRYFLPNYLLSPLYLKNHLKTMHKCLHFLNLRN